MSQKSEEHTAQLQPHIKLGPLPIIERKTTVRLALLHRLARQWSRSWQRSAYIRSPVFFLCLISAQRRLPVSPASPRRGSRSGRGPAGGGMGGTSGGAGGRRCAGTTENNRGKYAKRWNTKKK